MTLPSDFRLPAEFSSPKLILPGIVVVQGPAYQQSSVAIDRLRELHGGRETKNGIALIVVVDDSVFAAATLNNWLWVTFTRSNPAVDIYGGGEFIHNKHWGCDGPLIIDSRIKPQHAPPLEEDPAVTKRIEAMAAPGGPLHGLF